MYNGTEHPSPLAGHDRTCTMALIGHANGTDHSSPLAGHDSVRLTSVHEIDKCITMLIRCPRYASNVPLIIRYSDNVFLTYSVAFGNSVSMSTSDVNLPEYLHTRQMIHIQAIF